MVVGNANVRTYNFITSISPGKMLINIPGAE